MRAGGLNIGGMASAGMLIALAMIAGIQTWWIERRDQRRSGRSGSPPPTFGDHRETRDGSLSWTRPDRMPPK